MADTYVNINLNTKQTLRLQRYLIEYAEIEENFGKKQNLIALKDSVERAILESKESKEMDIQELYHKVENQKNRIKQQNLAIEKGKGHKLLLFEIFKILKESKYASSKGVSEVLGLLNDTLFGVSKKKGGTRSKGTIKKMKNKMLNK